MSADQLNNSWPGDGSIAVHACNADAVPDTLAKLAAFGRTPSVDDNDTRFALLDCARTLVNALETPRETMIKHNWANPALHNAITVCLDAGVFKVFTDGPQTVDELADKAEIKIDRNVLSRLMKHIAAMGYTQEMAPDRYKPTNFLKALNDPTIGDGYPALAGGAHMSFSKFAEYMKKTAYANPSDSDLKPYQFAYNTDMNMFDYMHANPPLGPQFNNHMSGYRQGRPSWMDLDFFPVEKELFTGVDTSAKAVLLVDIGGGQGHDLAEFLRKHPRAPGRLILQDKQDVIDCIQQLDSKIERVVHDFRTTQPFEAARAYYMHSVLHDWPDNECEDILKHIVAAMKPGYSKLLINEIVLPDQKADWQATALDLTMMVLFDSKERTRSEWERLLTSPKVGLKIVHVWSVKHSQESLIECELDLA